jgi:hypothetical protein
MNRCVHMNLGFSYSKDERVDESNQCHIHQIDLKLFNLNFLAHLLDRILPHTLMKNDMSTIKSRF